MLRPEVLTYFTPGVYTFTIGEDVPSNVTGFLVKGWSAGGAGATGAELFGGSGGGGAFFLASGLSRRRNGRSYTITVGAGGDAGLNSGNGGDTLFVADNGSFSIRAGGGQGGLTTTAGGPGGVATVIIPSIGVTTTLINGTTGSDGDSAAGIGGSASFGGSGGSQGFTNGPANLPSLPGGGGAGANPSTTNPPQNGADGYLQIEYIFQKELEQ